MIDQKITTLLVIVLSSVVVGGIISGSLVFNVASNNSPERLEQVKPLMKIQEPTTVRNGTLPSGYTYIVSSQGRYMYIPPNGDRLPDRNAYDSYRMMAHWAEIDKIVNDAEIRQRTEVW